MTFVEFINQNWVTILGCVIAAALIVCLIILYRKQKIDETYLDDLINYLDMIDDNESIVSVLAGYAKRAVMAVEQMVKAGIIPKTNEARKDMATQIVKELAYADGVELAEKDETAVSSLIEAEVLAMRNDLK